MPGSFKTEAIVLRSIRYGEADRVLHLYTADRGRVGAVAKGVRRVKSRLGGRLEPLSRVRLVMHQGRGELCTISQADTVHAHAGLREHRAALERGAQACEAVLRLLDSDRAEPARLQPALQRAGAAGRAPRPGEPRPGARVPPEAAAGGGLRARAGVVRGLRRGGAPRRLLAERGRRGLRGLRGGLVPARAARRTASSWRRSPARSPRRRTRPSARSSRPTARSPRRWSTTRTCGCGAWPRHGVA